MEEYFWTKGGVGLTEEISEQCLGFPIGESRTRTDGRNTQEDCIIDLIDGLDKARKERQKYHQGL
jgi:hypothetical protein